MGVHGPRQHLAFDIPADRDVILGRLRMGDAGDVLLDDRTLVEIGGDVMRRRADQLYAALIGLLVGVRPLERRQEGVVDVDDLPRHLLAQRIRKHLHVAGKHDQLGAGLLDHFHQLGFGPGLVLLGHLDAMEGDVVVDDHLLVLEMVGNDADDVDRQRPDLPAVEQVVQAMAETRHHQKNLHPLLGIADLRRHPEALGDRFEAFAQFGGLRACLADKGQPHKKQTRLEIVELRRVDDVAARFGEIAGNCRNDAAGGFAGDGQHIAFHRWSLVRECFRAPIHGQSREN